MKTIKTSLNVAIILAFFFQLNASAQKAGFTINGQVTGLKDSTKIYLTNTQPQKIIDSTIVINGKFTMSGQINEPARQVCLFTAKYENYVLFWVENKSMSMVLKAGEFRKAIIKGSSTQDENNELETASEQLLFKQDSLNKILSKNPAATERESLLKQLSALRDEEQQININYVKQHPKSLFAAHLLNVYSATWGKEKTESLYKNLNAAMKKTSYGKEISEYIHLNKNVQVGDKFQDFEQLNTLGKKVKLSEIRGKYILLDFWAAWCGPCREENPHLVELYKQYQPKGFNILGVSADNSKKAWLDAVKKDGLLWENVSDLRGDNNKAALIYGVNAYPTNYLINTNGVIIAKNVRGKALEDKLKELFP
ncbi:redoxin domain-containing protein [Mucilaginibacter calamicampi]|uniref:Redoxin domain-containing protein n=1 Tax=Mucilaginibacter calamicampi TaxID=1302352 RepID=A0ABW2YS03_9SPHI